MLSAFERSQISGQLSDFGLAKLFCEGRHLAFDPTGNDLVNARVAFMQIVQVGSFIAARIIAETVCAIR